MLALHNYNYLRIFIYKIKNRLELYLLLIAHVCLSHVVQGEMLSDKLAKEATQETVLMSNIFGVLSISP